MAHQKAPSRSRPDRPRRIGTSSGSRAGRPGTVGSAREAELTEVDREVIEALAGFRDSLRDRVPLGSRYTVRQVAAVEPPPPIAPADVKQIRESLGLSQPVFGDFLGTSTSTIRSWEQGQKPPSPLARRMLGFIAADPPYWKRRLRSMIWIRGGEVRKKGDEEM